MIRMIAEGVQGLRGSCHLLTFRPGGEAMFNVSMDGFWRSFGGMLFALPLVVLIYFERQYLEVGVDAGIYAAIYLGSWVSFPVAAAIATAVVGARHRFLPWVIVHNWGVVWLYVVIATIWSLQVIGLISADFRDFLMYLYVYYLRVLVHWRIAYVTLGLPTITAAATAIVPIIVSYIVVTLIGQTFAAAPPAG